MVHLPVRRAVPLFVLALLLLPGLPAMAAVPQQGPVVEVELFEFGVEPPGVQLTPGTTVTFHITNKGQVDHNLYIGDGGAVAKWDPLIKPGESANVNFTVPASGVTVYYCNVQGHRELGMLGNLTLRGQSAPAASAGGPGPKEIRALGVSFFAYWVGVVSFIVLFAVLAATFFLLRYGETKHWTDQTARPSKEKDAAPKSMSGTWVVLGIVLVVFLVAAVQIVRVV